MPFACCSVIGKVGSLDATWIGLSIASHLCDSGLDCRRRGWAWADGTKYSYPQFHDWQDDDPDSGDLCGTFHDPGGSMVAGWYGKACSYKARYICEKGNYCALIG